MALGKPIVQYEMTEGRISAKDASLYAKPNDEVDFANKIVELIDNQDLRTKMGKYGRDRVENELQWNRQEPNLLAAYESL